MKERDHHADLLLLFLKDFQEPARNRTCTRTCEDDVKSELLQLPTAREGECIGRDEMNLAEFPIALLSHRAKDNVLTLHKERVLTMTDGRQLRQEWTVTGAPEYGLPQSCDEDVLLGLLKIGADNGFTTPRVSFTQRALLNLIRWPSQAWSHERLSRSLARLKTTSILAKNSFWDRQRKGYQTVHFGIVDSYQLADRGHWDKGGALNWARFSDEFYSSIQGGYIKPIALGLYFGLDSSVAKRLYRYLDKKRYQKERFEINLMTLAITHVGLSEDKCRYPSWVKQMLDRAHQTLIACGFLKSATYDHDREGNWKVVYEFGDRKQTTEQGLLPGVEAVPESGLLKELVARGITQSVAQELLESKPEKLIWRQLDVFDYLKRADAGGMRNPPAFLLHAIRDEWQLQPPGYVSPDERARRAAEGEASRIAQTSAVEESKRDAEDLERLKSELDPDVLNGLQVEAFERVRAQLGKVLTIKPTSPFVMVELHSILRQRYLGGVTPTL